MFDLVWDGNDVVYCDLFYLIDSDNFIVYYECGFLYMDQGWLVCKLWCLVECGVQVVVLNSDLEIVYYFYVGFEVLKVNVLLLVWQL